MKVLEPSTLDHFSEFGYAVFGLDANDLIDNVNKDISKIVESTEFRVNSKIYSYNDSPRIVESWKLSENCKALSKHPKIMSFLNEVFKAEPKPFSTINFLHSTQQPFHSDYVHFGTIPELLLAGSWIALEDIDPKAGPIQVVPKSHKLKIFNFFEDVGAEIPKSLSQAKKNYSAYEDWVKQVLEDKGLSPVTPRLKKGDCVIWDANVLHGSPKCDNLRLSRKSMATHWVSSEVEESYVPMFSSPHVGIFKRRILEFY